MKVYTMLMIIIVGTEDKRMYSIKQVAECLNCNSNTIRFYEKKGLIAPKRDANGYRKFTNEDVELLQFILIYRQLGFSVEAIQRICVHESNSQLDVFTTQYNIINQQIHAMIKIRDVLGSAVEELLETNKISEEIQMQLANTVQFIGESEQWSDCWNFDTWASNYDSDIRIEGSGLAFYKNYDLVIHETANEVVEMSGDMIEIGIGTGNLTKCIVDRYQEKNNGRIPNMIGIDQSIHMLKEAKRKLPQVSMRLGTFLKLPLENCCCNTIVSSYAFHHCNSKEKVMAIAEMDRVLKPQGRIIITDLMFQDEVARNVYEKKCSVREREDLEDEFFANVDELERIIKDYGYQVKHVQIDPLIWMVVGIKI